MAVSKSVFLVLAALAVAQSARVARQAHLGVWPHAVPVHGGDDGSYWSGKYGPENIQDPSALATPHGAPVAVPAAWPHAAAAWSAPAPAWAPAAAWPHAAAHAAVAPHWGADDGSYWPGKYGPEAQ